MKQSGLLVLIASLVAGCGTVGAIVTAPIMAPIMFFSARMNDRDDFLDRARQNDRPLLPSTQGPEGTPRQRSSKRSN